MRKSVIIVDADSEECLAIGAMLESRDFRTDALRSLTELTDRLQAGGSRAIILDLDSVPLDNGIIKRLREINPASCLIGLSSRTFHPELEEAIRTHISVCLSKPVNMEELLYWLRRVCGGGPNPRASPKQRERDM